MRGVPAAAPNCGPAYMLFAVALCSLSCTTLACDNKTACGIGIRKAPCFLNMFVLKARQDSTQRAAAVHVGPPQHTAPRVPKVQVSMWHVAGWLAATFRFPWLCGCRSAAPSAASCSLTVYRITGTVTNKDTATVRHR